MVRGAWYPRGDPKVGVRTYVYLQYIAVDVSYYKHIKKYIPIIDTLIQYTLYIYIAPHVISQLGEGRMVPQG